MEHVDIIPPSERRRINETVLEKEDKMMGTIHMRGVR